MLAMITGMVSRPVIVVLTITMVGTAMLVAMVNTDVVMVVGMYEQAQHAREGGVSHAHGGPQGKPKGLAQTRTLQRRPERFRRITCFFDGIRRGQALMGWPFLDRSASRIAPDNPSSKCGEM